MKILITGGTGFLGKAVAKMLKHKKHAVLIVDNHFTSNEYVNETVFINGSVTDTTLLDDIMPTMDFVFHFAGILGTNETLDIIQKTNEVNINGTVNVLEACTKLKVPMLFTSKPNPPGFLNPYSITKIAAESYCNMFHKMYGTEVTIPKIMYLYGPGQLPYPEANYKKYIPTFILAALKNEPLKIYGSGEQTIDPIYIDDAAQAMYDLMIDMLNEKESNGKIFEVGSGIGITVNTIAELIVELTNSNSEIVHIPMRLGEPEISTVVADVTSLPIQHRTHIRFDDGLKKTIEYYRNTGKIGE